MQQIPMGENGKFTPAQRRRATQYAFDLMAGFLDDTDDSEELSNEMKKGFRTLPIEDDNP
jgi:hypothetical protein